jgi:hypothetical protein
MKLQYTFTRKFFLRGLHFPPDPAEGVTPLCTPPCGRVYILLGCKSSWGINTAKNKRPLNQEDNQAPQPTISHLETNLNNSTDVVYVGI